MCHFGGIYRFFAIWLQKIFFTPILAKDFFSKSCKTPKTAENRETTKTKVVEIGILVYMQPFKIWKNEKKIFRKNFFFHQNDIEKKIFSAKKIENRVWYIKMTGSMSRLRLWTLFLVLKSFLDTFGRFFGWELAGGLIGPTLI